MRRMIRWVEGFKDGKQTVHWGQLKEVELAGREKPVSRPTERQLNFKQGKQFKHNEELQAQIQAEAEKVIALAQSIADGVVTRVQYSAEARSFSYTQEIEVDGETVTENINSDDETLLEAGEAFAQYLADTLATEGKPLEVAGPPVNE